MEGTREPGEWHPSPQRIFSLRKAELWQSSSNSKRLTCKSLWKPSLCGSTWQSRGDPGLIPALGRAPGGGNGNPLHYSCLENPMDRGAWRVTVHGVTKSRIRLKWLLYTKILCVRRLNVTTCFGVITKSSILLIIDVCLCGSLVFWFFSSLLLSS